MGAPYNWWGTNNVTTIDGYIDDMLDNNGGGWVNYTPFYTSAAMTSVDWNGTSPANIPLGRELSGSLFFSKTMTLADSPYYLVGPWTITPGVRITIEPGVRVLANTTNSSIEVHGEIHALGNSTDPVFFGVNPSLSWSSNSGYWNGIKSQTPVSGTDALIMRNTTVSGPTNYWYIPGQSYTGNWQLFNMRNFMRSSGNVAIDNVTFRDAGSFSWSPNTYVYQMNSFEFKNVEINNISSVDFNDGHVFYNSCNGDMRGELSIIRSSVYISNPHYISTYGSSSNCNPSGLPWTHGWTYDQSNVRLSSTGFWSTATASNPGWYSGTFTDTWVTLQSNSGMSPYLELRNSTFTATGTPSSTAWAYAQNSQNRGTEYLTADSNSYGKWTVTNNSILPTNGWTGINYEYPSTRMEAHHNWWGTTNLTSIDGWIEDINDNNGGNWVNYCPMWNQSSRINTTNNCTRTQVDFLYPGQGSAHVGYNLSVRYRTTMVSIGTWELDNISIGSVNTAVEWINLTNLTFGWHELCAQVSGLGNQQQRSCLSFRMTPYFPEVNITSHGANTSIPPSQSNITIHYTHSNLTSGWWLINGNYASTMALGATYETLNGLQYGSNIICLIGNGLSNLVDQDCITIWREYPVVYASILYPSHGSIIYSNDVQVQYLLSNVTSGWWTLDQPPGSNEIESTLDIQSNVEIFYRLDYGEHTICLHPSGLDGYKPAVCTVFEIRAPPIEVSILGPPNGTMLDDDTVDIQYLIQNATSANWTVDGVPVMSVTFWSQNAMLSGIGFNETRICIEAYGLDNQYQNDCVIVTGMNRDSDGDGVPDRIDLCPETEMGIHVLENGCPDPENDLDNDGVRDIDDLCPNTEIGMNVDDNGCSPNQVDSDQDGVMDAYDDCDETPIGAAVDSSGCTDGQVDTDSDGYYDDVDVFPLDPTQWSDQDGDGFGDNNDGNNPDRFVTDSSQWSDFDRDGWGDNPDGNLPDSCPTLPGVANGTPGPGCPWIDSEESNETNEETSVLPPSSAPANPMTGAIIVVPNFALVDSEVVFQIDMNYSLGDEFYGVSEIHWFVEDVEIGNGTLVEHRFPSESAGLESSVQVCVQFNQGPNVCVNRTVEVQSSEDYILGTNQEQNKSSSFAIIGVGAILLMILTIGVTSVIMRRNNGEEEIDYDSNQFTSITNIQSDISEFSESADVIDSNIETELEPDENGYYWKEYPEESGLWYYRGEHDSEWVYWDA